MDIMFEKSEEFKLIQFLLNLAKRAVETYWKRLLWP